MVVLEGSKFRIAQPVQTLTLPPTGESITTARFEVKPLAQSQSAADLAEIRIRLYYEFNLLDVMILRAEVVGKFDEKDASRFGTSQPVTIRQDRPAHAAVDLEHIQPRSMHIDVTREGQLYALQFVCRNEADQELALTGSVRLQASDLEDQLIAIRRHWYDIAMGETFSATVEGTANQFLPAVRKLAEAGRRLWVALFEREAKSAIYQIGKWLQEHPLARDSVIQVSAGSDAMDFVVPWSVVYDRPVPQKEYELPDIEGFWGIRYCVEQRLPKFMEDGEAPAASEPEIKMAFMLWEQFRNATEQKALMRRLAARAPGKLEISDPPVVDATACYKLLADCDKHLLYFYTHGYTRLRESNLSGSGNLQPFAPVVRVFARRLAAPRGARHPLRRYRQARLCARPVLDRPHVWCALSRSAL